MTKRRVQGGEATSERRRRDGVYQKSYKRAFLPLIYLLPRARVSRTSHAWRVHAARDKSKVSGFALPTISAIPRVRTYHTKEPSRFVHALSARPLKVQGGRGSDTCADGSRNFCQPSPAGEGVARSVTDEVLPCAYCKKTYLAMFAHRRAPKSEPRGSP